MKYWMAFRVWLQHLLARPICWREGHQMRPDIQCGYPGHPMQTLGIRCVRCNHFQTISRGRW